VKKYREYMREHGSAPHDKLHALIRAARKLDYHAEIERLGLEGFVPVAEAPAYLISQHGQIYSTTRNTVRHVRPGIKPGGYRFVGLRVGGKSIYRMVHRLVAIAFLPNPDALPEINHIDGDKLNNRLSNLEWCTRKHNTQHALSIGLIKRGADNSNSKLTPDAVREVRDASGTYRQIADRFGVSPQTVCNVKRRSGYKEVA
jgi:hypothetical protein